MSALTERIVKETALDYYGISILIRPIANGFLVSVRQCQDRLAQYCRLPDVCCGSLEEALDHIATTLEPPRGEEDRD